MVDFNKIMSSLAQSGVASGFAGGLAGGALSSALTTKKGRKTAGKLLKIGGVAAVGGLAWKAYQNYQQEQGAAAAPSTQQNYAQLSRGQFDLVEEGDKPSASTNLLLIRAMIAAAMADGHLDATEQSRIFEQADQLGLHDAEKAVLFDELRNPRTAEVIAGDARDPALATEVYTASILAIDETSKQGRAYLWELAMRLNLPNSLVAEIHNQVSSDDAGDNTA